jgi:hypothetical protein
MDHRTPLSPESAADSIADILANFHGQVRRDFILEMIANMNPGLPRDWETTDENRHQVDELERELDNSEHRGLPTDQELIERFRRLNLDPYADEDMEDEENEYSEDEDPDIQETHEVLRRIQPYIDPTRITSRFRPYLGARQDFIITLYQFPRETPLPDAYCNCHESISRLTNFPCYWDEGEHCRRLQALGRDQDFDGLGTDTLVTVREARHQAGLNVEDIDREIARRVLMKPEDFGAVGEHFVERGWVQEAILDGPNYQLR